MVHPAQQDASKSSAVCVRYVPPSVEEPMEPSKKARSGAHSK
jgi:hypothetical protein